MKKSEKRFDCVEFKRSMQQELTAEMAGMSHEEQLRFLRTRAEQGLLGRWWNRVGSAGEQSRRERKRKAG